MRILNGFNVRSPWVFTEFFEKFFPNFFGILFSMLKTTKKSCVTGKERRQPEKGEEDYLEEIIIHPGGIDPGVG